MVLLVIIVLLISASTVFAGVGAGILAGTGTGVGVESGETAGADAGIGIAAAQPEDPEDDNGNDDEDEEEADDDTTTVGLDDLTADDDGDGDSAASPDETEDDDESTADTVVEALEEREHGDWEEAVNLAESDDDWEMIVLAIEDQEDYEALNEQVIENDDYGDIQAYTAALEEHEDEIPADPEDEGAVEQVGLDDAVDWDPQSWAEGTLEAIYEFFQEAIEWLTDNVVNQLLGTPTPTNDGTSGVFGQPADVDAEDDPVGAMYYQLFDDFFIPYVMPLVGGIIGLVLLGTLIGPPLAVIGRGSARSVFLGIATLAVVLVVYWDFVSILHYLADETTLLFLPEGEEVIDDEADLAAGTIGGAVLLTTLGIIKVALFVLLQATRWAILLVAPFFLPFLLVGAYAGYFQTVKSVSSFGIWQYYGLLVMNIPVAMLLRVADAVDFGAAFAESELLHAVDDEVAEAVAATLSFAVTMGFWIGAFLISFAILVGFGLASIFGRGAFLSNAGNAVGRLRQINSPIGKGGWGSRSQTTAHSPFRRTINNTRNGNWETRTDGGGGDGRDNGGDERERGRDRTIEQQGQRTRRRGRSRQRWRRQRRQEREQREEKQRRGERRRRRSKDTRYGSNGDGEDGGSDG